MSPSCSGLPGGLKSVCTRLHTQAMWGYTFSYLGVEADEYNTFITTPSLASNDEKEQRE